MKILLVADSVERCLWGEWTDEISAKLSDIDIILSAGDLSSLYLEFLRDKLNIPLIYVPGNHDGGYKDTPPKRCINTDGIITDLKIRKDNSHKKNVRIFGLGGSMRYKDGPYQYSEDEQRSRAEKLLRELGSLSDTESADVNILLTHAPCRGYGDMDDIPHRGFDCFNDLLNRWKPKMHCYGHIHQEYNDYNDNASKETGFTRLIKHPSGTYLINGCGHQFIQF